MLNWTICSRLLGLSVIVATLLSMVVGAVASDAGKQSAIPLIKYFSPHKERRLLVKIESIGQRKVGAPLLFDTGSGATSVDCELVLPKEDCTPDGIKINAETTIDGVRVTTIKHKQSFQNVAYLSQRAYAVITIGDGDKTATTTEEVPFFIRYAVVDMKSGAPVKTDLHGIFGAAQLEQGSRAIGHASILRRMPVADGFRSGYYISPVGTTWRPCGGDFRTCETTLSLHIGVPETNDPTIKWAPFRNPNDRQDAAAVNVCIAFSGKEDCADTVFDTGMANSLSSQSTTEVLKRAKNGDVVRLHGDQFGEYADVLGRHDSWAPFDSFKVNVVGIGYFETNSLFVDFANSQTGFRIGH